MTLANGLVKQTQSTSRGPKMIWPSKACALANLDSGDGQSAPRTTAADRGGQRSGLSNFMYGLYVPLHDSRICEDVHESRYIPALCGTPCIVALFQVVDGEAPPRVTPTQERAATTLYSVHNTAPAAVH
ncbi:hypothetical protein TgHK011_008587 [Trichoderma gracile]|nr:hypothetical protein TgHK011_008587 [Trichoderma gracile]